mmetsp:Transcript_21200/g.53781  ORF Transcript_21200/g.53781 Transcript_21200/m.53781 type:complete len:212 (-) Transcript_21200:784-1419(-)
MGSTAAATPMEEKSCALRATESTMSKSKRNGWTLGMACATSWPTARLRPDSTKPLEIARLPPMSSSRPKSNFLWTAGHVNNAWPGRTTEGMKKSARAGAHASEASLSKVSPYGDLTSSKTLLRNMKRRTCKTWSSPTSTSSREKDPTSFCRLAYSSSSTFRSRPLNFRLRTYRMCKTAYARSTQATEIGNAKKNHRLQEMWWATSDSAARK